MFMTRSHRNSSDELNRLINGFFGPAIAVAGSPSTSWPRLDVSETDSTVHISAELPGVKQEELDVEVQADTLRVSGEKKDERVVNDHQFHSVERRFGRFERTVTLPAEVDGTLAEATFKDGVLSITLPKLKPITAQKITVKSVS
jgi:HSP20 family protein